MPTIVPGSKPRLSAQELAQRLAPHNIDRSRHPLIVVGLRGYYRDTMGAPGVNDRGIYDDALFVDTPSATLAFNGNTDPASYRRGHGRAQGTKGMASLNDGAWFVHRLGKHKGLYLALVQTGGPVTVTRDGTPNYPDTGMFGINIHKGGYATTSSIGCQTIHPDQWQSFIRTVEDQARRYFGARWDRVVIPYVLISGGT
jgi:lysozyme